MPEDTETDSAGAPAAENTDSSLIVVEGLSDEALAIPHVVELTEPRDGIPRVIDTEQGLQRCADAIRKGTGPLAIDAERASGFRYGQRAFLVQMRREGSGSWLIDPEPFNDLSVLQDAIGDAEWIIHASTQDLPCLLELGLWPTRLFDTELAARLAGLPRVGLAAVVEQMLGFRLAKEHSAADWSTRPLPEPWLRYATLDVEVLIELREELVELLSEQGKLEFAQQEFAAILAAGVAPPKKDPWRRTSGVHQIRDRRKLAAVRELWLERESLAQKRDVAPGRLLPDSAIVAAARSMPTTVPQLLVTKGFSGRQAQREAPRWLRALQAARALDELPPMHIPSHAPPPPRSWEDKDPAAFTRLTRARAALAEVSGQWNIPVENLLLPDTLRRICWAPPTEPGAQALDSALQALHARPWQRELCVPALVKAFSDSPEDTTLGS